MLLSTALVLAQATPQLLVDLDAASGPPASSTVDSNARLLGEAFGKLVLGGFPSLFSEGLVLFDETTELVTPLSGSIHGQPRDAEETDAGYLVFTSLRFGVSLDLFASEGTPGTVTQLDIGSTSQGGKAESNLVGWRGRAWVLSNGPSSSIELWSTDGTQAETRLEWTFPAAVGASGGSLYVLHDRLLVDPPNSEIGLFVFETPGAPPSDILPLNVLGDLAPAGGRLREFQGDLVLTAEGSSGGNELWRTDGTAGGTVLIDDLWPGPDSSSPILLDADENNLWFTADTAAEGRELWLTDGTTAGTRLVVDLAQGPADGNLATGGIVATGQLVIGRNTPSVGPSLWISDGTAAGTQLLAGPVAPTGLVTQMQSDGESVVFNVSGPAQGIWRSDGTANGTLRLTAYEAVTPFVFPPVPTFQPLGDRFWFTSDSEAPGGSEVWATDGSPSGTSIAANLAPELVSDFSDPEDLIRLGDRFLFTARPNGLGRELYVSDGTAQGTLLLGDLNPGSASSDPEFMGTLGDRILFSAETPQGREPWVTDGTVAGTRQLGDLNPGQGDSQPGPAAIMDGFALFTASSSTSAGQDLLMRTDGTLQGTQSVSLPSLFYPFDLSANAGRLGDRLYFGAAFVNQPFELYSTDGTAAGTAAVPGMEPGPFFPVDFERLGSRLFFQAQFGVAQGIELFVTDGSTAGTGLFLDVVPGSISGLPNSLTRVGDSLFFFSKPFVSGGASDLWVTDGSLGGTLRITDYADPDLDLTRMREFDGGVVFIEERAVNDFRIGFSDGTAAGTLSSPSPPGASLFDVKDPRLIRLGGSDALVFEMEAPISGRELWTIDSPGSAPSLLAEVQLAYSDSLAKDPLQFKGSLYFSAVGPGTGSELYRIELDQLGIGGVDIFGLGCSGQPGPPEISWSGSANAGSQFTVELDQAAPASLALAYYSNPLALASFPVGCTVYVGQPQLLAVAPTDIAGRASIPIALPAAPTLIGQDYVIQWVATEPNGPFTGSFALSDALELFIGP